jgi:hypothetical protein
VLGAQGSRSQITERWIVASDEFSKGALAIRIVQVDWMFHGGIFIRRVSAVPK